MNWFVFYAIVSVSIWVAYWIAAEREPTAHGRDCLNFIGCGLGMLWPLAIAYLVIASPLIAWSWWQSRGER